MPQNSRKSTTKSNNYISSQKQIDLDKPQSFLNTSNDIYYSIKHAHIPSIPSSNMALFHFIVLIFSLTATMMQYLHIYRTVWWLPHSHAKKALNFYLIDPHIFGYLITIEVVPFLYSIYKQILQMQSRRIWFLLSFTFCMIIWTIWFLAFIIFSFCVYMKTTGFYLLILFYPPIAYALIYCHYLPTRLFKSFKSWLTSQLNSNINLNSATCTYTTTATATTATTTTSTATTTNSTSISSLLQESSMNEQNSTNNSNVSKNAASIASSSSEMGSTAQQSTQVQPLSSSPLSHPTTTTNFPSSSIPSYHSPSPPINTPPSATQLALEQYGIFYYSKTVRHSSGMVQHTCTMNPEEIREEVERLKSDFNRKFRDIFFGTLFTFFYASLVPLLFVPKPIMTSNGTIVNAVHYDGVWCGQHVFTTAGTAFLLYSVQHLSPAYVDVLHRCALHLGRWRREEGRSANVPYNPWSQLQTFPKGTLVKHVRGLFRAVGVHNSAEPGNNMHNRFFCFFYPALRLANVMCALVFILLGIQYALLVQNYEWYKIISVSSMMFFNVFSLYKILRNRFLLSRCYKEENLLTTSSNSTTSPSTTPSIIPHTLSSPTTSINSNTHTSINPCPSNCTSHHPHHLHHQHHQFNSIFPSPTSSSSVTSSNNASSPHYIHYMDHLHVD